MTKTLTEKFVNNELDDRLYYFTQKMSQDNVEIGHSFEFNMVRADDGEYLDWFLIHEVVAPVPSFDEYKELTQKVGRLELDSEAQEQVIQELKEQLNEANKVIKTTNQITGNIDLSNFDYEHRRKIDGITMETDSYLEKWGVK